MARRLKRPSGTGAGGGSGVGSSLPELSPAPASSSFTSPLRLLMAAESLRGRDNCVVPRCAWWRGHWHDYLLKPRLFHGDEFEQGPRTVAKVAGQALLPAKASTFRIQIQRQQQGSNSDAGRCSCFFLVQICNQAYARKCTGSVAYLQGRFFGHGPATLRVLASPQAMCGPGWRQPCNPAAPCASRLVQAGRSPFALAGHRCYDVEGISNALLCNERSNYTIPPVKCYACSFRSAALVLFSRWRRPTAPHQAPAIKILQEAK